MALEFDFGLRASAGANQAAGKVSLRRGPLLLAYDQARNSFDEEAIPALNLARLSQAVAAPASLDSLRQYPWLEVRIPSDDGRVLNLVDFASAGAAGTHYRTWLPALNPPPAPAFTQQPRDGERVRPGPAQFRWRGPSRGTGTSCRLEIAADPAFARPLLVTNAAAHRLGLDLAALVPAPGNDRWWRVVTMGPGGESVPDVPPARFTLAADAPPQVLPAQSNPGPNGELILYSLRRGEQPKFGSVLSEKFAARDAAGTQVNGRDQMLMFSVGEWPEEDFTVMVRVRIDELPHGRIAQVFSAWAGPMDDPLRIVVDDGKVFARIEAGGSFGTPGVPINAGQWHHLAAVKRGATLQLFLDGKVAGSSPAPEFSVTAARDCALGGNPHYTGDEHLAATFADFGLWARAWSEPELRQAAEH